ncbi:heparanase-like protein 1 [Alnus glutinosa]|uniref:heparanase-like protein 1 n=1 Tax=Alnus glutinosa TaxID=3517 RepID=UPI002D79319A|nr:heparanase-like protein 1 [Alnus glutinosa]
MGFIITLFLLLVSLPAILLAQEINFANIVVNGTTTIGETDDNYICATIDWFPSDTCRYNYCMLQNSSAITLDLSNPLLAKTIQAFRNLRLRIGGSPQDQVIYNVGSPSYPCHPFQQAGHGSLFGLTTGCLYMWRWDELNQFFNKTRAIVTFGLNALYGRKKQDTSILWVGDWDPSNTNALMNYTISKGYHIDSWEFGNELSGSGIGARVEAAQYAKDVINLKSNMNELYRKSNYKPKLAAPGGFFDRSWYTQLLQDSGSGIVDIVTHHIYNLGAGNDPNLISKILNPSYLSNSILGTFKNIEGMIQEHGPWASLWVGESGGAFQGGGRHVSDRFVNSFWYLDQLGMAAKYNTKVYCRQTLVGANYALLNRTTMEPNPDYYSALLWHRLMGKRVLEVHGLDTSPYLRPYAHCSKGRAGITLLLINLSNQIDFLINVYNHTNIKLKENEKRRGESPFMRCLKAKVGSDGESLMREEYHLSPEDGNLRSQTSLLNGNPLNVSNGELPRLDPVFREEHAPIKVAPLSIAFIVIPNFEAPACV